MGWYKFFPSLVFSKDAVSSGNKGRALFKTKQNLSPQNWPSAASMYTMMAIRETYQIACSWSSTLVDFAFSSILNDRISSHPPSQIQWKINPGLILSENGRFDIVYSSLMWVGSSALVEVDSSLLKIQMQNSMNTHEVLIIVVDARILGLDARASFCRH